MKHLPQYAEYKMSQNDGNNKNCFCFEEGLNPDPLYEKHMFFPRDIFNLSFLAHCVLLQTSQWNTITRFTIQCHPIGFRTSEKSLKNTQQENCFDLLFFLKSRN